MMKVRLTFHRHYRHPVEKVWRAITDPNALAKWLGWVPERIGMIEPRQIVYAHGEGTITLTIKAESEATHLEAVFVGSPDNALASFDAVLDRIVIDPAGFLWRISEKEQSWQSKAEDPTSPESSLI
jgi:hypothetical protein